ncbi:MAG: hypothetical protein J5684_06990 [Eubacterium sp.]|nr:hypothetical protein [Eubacterium sp.]
MIQCPNCGGSVVFDIATQQMKCQSCSSLFNPYDFKYGNGAEESTEYDVTVFKCPQCGGEIASTDETAAAFCSYCGSSNVLESRISKEKKPQLIIPFKKTKQQCKDLFAKKVGKSLFAPSDYKNCKVESFRGIYMPYWMYDMSQNGQVSGKTSTSHRSGDYIITDHYFCSGNLQAVYNGVSYDASSTFADDISGDIAPYSVKDITTFTPSYLSGYYADIADVPMDVYASSAKESAESFSADFVKAKTPFAREFVENGLKIPTTAVNVTRSAMFPVWFMSYRRGNRVAYATVNGQTGKVSADIPISISKYIVCAVIAALLCFPVLQFLFTITPQVMMIVASVISLVVAIMYNGEMKKILSIENHEDDLGYKVKKGMVNPKQAKKQASGKKKGNGLMNVGQAIGIAVFLFFFLGVAGTIFGSALSSLTSSSPMGRAVVILILLVIIIGVTISANKKISQMIYKNGFAASIWTSIAVGILFLVAVINPVADIYYYIAIAVSIVGILLTLLDMMRCFNLMAMRPLPQFKMYQGGDDRA